MVPNIVTVTKAAWGLSSTRRVAMIKATTAMSNGSALASSRHFRHFATDIVEPVRKEYVHPLSQIVLEYLQLNRSDWLVKTGLDRGLFFHRDGTFELRFPAYKSDQISRIWTSYEDQERKHFLSVRKGNMEKRYIIQNNQLPVWNLNQKSLPERIHDTVEEMIRSIDVVATDKKVK
jgi:hypothetical protein